MSSISPKLQKGKMYMADMFAGYGVTHAFFVEAVLRHTLVAMEKRGIKRVMAHSEKTAGYMADGYARAARRPGLCMAQSVGAANLASGLQDAFLAHSPVVAITGRKPSSYQHRNAYQELNHIPLFEPVTKFNVAVENTADMPRLLRQAFREATTGAPAPVHLDMPNHQAGLIEAGDVAEELVVEKRYGRVPPFRPAAAIEDVRAVVECIYKAERPFIVSGGGANISNAGDEVLRMLDTLKIPLGTSVDGKGIVPEDHPLCLGCVGNYGRSATNAVLAEADLVIFIGCGTCDQTTNAWTLPKPGTPVVQVDINPNELGRNYPNTASMLGDAKASLALLVNELRGAHPNEAWGRKATAALNSWRATLEAMRNAGVSPIRAERLCRELQHVLPHNAVLVADTGFSAIWTASHIDIVKPAQRYIRAAGGSLGWSFPASLGVKCGVPDQPVICFTGDGGFWYHLVEMETAVRNNIPTVTIVNNNEGLGQCYRFIVDIYDGAPGRPEDMYAFTGASFAQIAKDMGAVGLRVEKAADIGPAVKEALNSGKPAVVEVITELVCDPQVY
ncbi:putative acetolactate synthase large subunit [uncultured delta proteobacterium]|uniref:Putative acetolactate synthase large subunit n=1 Tax=uncultured delta proteobacterium TaxID=34034 RepID=A0A212K9Z7_9DELT|nr:putative acetolactate synthase large subunit [uncultured delta proteobacterium]